VLCDRYADSTVAYQHHGRGIARAAVDAANEVATGGLAPTLTLLLDVAPDVGLRRAGSASDYFERERLEFHERVREGYLELAQAEPGRWRVMDATRPAAELADAGWSELASRARLTTR
jgi:dTMP kinase